MEQKVCNCSQIERRYKSNTARNRDLRVCREGEGEEEEETQLEITSHWDFTESLTLSETLTLISLFNSELWFSAKWFGFSNPIHFFFLDKLFLIEVNFSYIYMYVYDILCNCGGTMCDCMRYNPPGIALWFDLYRVCKCVFELRLMYEL